MCVPTYRLILNKGLELGLFNFVLIKFIQYNLRIVQRSFDVNRLISNLSEISASSVFEGLAFKLICQPDTKETLSSYVRLIKNPLPLAHRQCPDQNLLVLPTLLPIACLTGQNHGQSQLQPHQSSDEPHTFIGHCEHSFLPSFRICITFANTLCKRNLLKYYALLTYLDPKLCHAPKP